MKSVWALLAVMACSLGAKADLGIHGPTRVGMTTGHPFVFLIPATDATSFSAIGLPDGLVLDPAAGVISGSAAKAGEYKATLQAKNTQSSVSRDLTLEVGDHPLALTPPMGWNSWNVWGCNIDEKKIRDAADELVSTGLAAHGFNYINIDDCWMDHRDARQRIVPTSAFPDMKALGDYIHSKGLRFGIYTSPGPFTCQGKPGSLHHERDDARTYADWGVDYLKYDWCSYKGDLEAPYRQMGQELHALDRDIVYSLCQYGAGDVWKWGASIGGNLWRTTTDIQDDWQSLSDIGFGQSGLENYAGPGHWNDPDMLVVGMLGGAWQQGGYHPTHLTRSEQFVHISLWSMLSAPLLIGADLTKLDDFTKSLLSNDEVLAINQDALGKQAKRIKNDHNLQVWTRPLADGSQAVAVFNTSDADQTVSLDEVTQGISNFTIIRDLWKHQNLTIRGLTSSATVQAHGVLLVKVGN